MIEREFVEQKKKEFQIQEFVAETLKNAGFSHAKLQRTPLGEKVVIFTSRPGLIVGRKGQTISKLTETLKKKFGLENPQVEIAEVSNPMLDARIVAEKISSELERFGANRFKGIMHKATEDVLSAGAMGVEIRLSGKLPSSRAKSWRVAGGYLRKCGDAAMTFVNKSIHTAQLKPGIIGIQVRIMPPGVIMPDEIKLKEDETKVEDSTGPNHKSGNSPIAQSADADLHQKAIMEPEEAKAIVSEELPAAAENEKAPEQEAPAFAAAANEKAPAPKKKRASKPKAKKAEGSEGAPAEKETKEEVASSNEVVEGA